jgi:transcriptional regulator with PAS, ATPase and Fis domain
MNSQTPEQPTEQKDGFYGPVPRLEGALLAEWLKLALPLIAKVTGGYATITDRDGLRLCTVDSSGAEHPESNGTQFRAAEKITGPCIVGSDFEPGAHSWVLPLGNYMLACSNLERVQRDAQLLEALRNALPVIAQILGGEAVLFDAEGRRMMCYAFDGSENVDSIGRISGAAAEAMRTNRPTLGPSTSVEGAVAVRIPLTSTYGFGFNNEKSVKREKSLLAEVRKNRNTRYSFSDIEGDSESLRAVCGFAKNVAAGESSILLCGETGTGKELFAQAIHNESHRRAKPFVAINCGALPASIIESHLFGYVEGSFTGARRGGSSGAFEQANGGTVFLDEVSEMDLTLQAKLLRVLQEREVTPIGGSKPKAVDIRFLSATNRNLWEMVEKGLFRPDLYYRLNVVQVNIPALRNRRGDVNVLVRHFLAHNNQLFGKFVFSVSPEAMSLLTRHDWPGNVRELQNCIEYAFNMISTKEQVIQPQHLPHYLQDGRRRQTRQGEGTEIGTVPEDGDPAAVDVPTLAESLRRAERQSIAEALRACGNHRRNAAKLLGISTTTLWRRMAAVGLSSES